MKTGRVSRWVDEQRVRLELRELVGAVVLALAAVGIWTYVAVVFGGRFSW